MTIQQCKYVVEIARCGSFNEAAKQLFVAQSSLSVSIKQLEQELGIKIFERSGNGVYLTDMGAEFVCYARQIVEQTEFVLDRYNGNEQSTHLYISTQHYDFVANIFGKLMNSVQEKQYRFSLREMKTYDVIRETENAFCDIGIIAMKGNDCSVMERYLNKRGIQFTPVREVPPHVFLRKDHPLAQGHIQLTAEQLKEYPYVTYEQGEHNPLFFSEELHQIPSQKQIQISDRATLMNVLLATDAFTVGTGIMPSELNDGRIVSIAFDSDDHYTIGYLLRADRKISDLTQQFIDLLLSEVKS